MRICYSAPLVAFTLLSISCSQAVGPKAVQEPEPAIAECDPDQHDPELASRAKEVHARGQRDTTRIDKQLETFEQASSLYAEYLERFPCSENSYEMRFLAAEVLFFKLKRHSEAAHLYLEAGRQRPTGRFTQDALYKATDAFQRVKSSDQQRALLLETLDLYELSFPQSDDIPEIQFRRARVHYDAGEYAEAFEVLTELIETFPESNIAPPAADMILESLERAPDADRLQRAHELLKSPDFEDAHFREHLERLLNASEGGTVGRAPLESTLEL